MSYEQVHNRKEMEAQRRLLRKYETSAETLLWSFLRDRKLDGRKFRRQHSVGYYVLDFYCPAEKLAVELDGIHHFTEEGIEHDEERAQYLSSLKIRVIRFENKEILDSPEKVLAEIKRNLKPSPHNPSDCESPP